MSVKNNFDRSIISSVNSPLSVDSYSLNKLRRRPVNQNREKQNRILSVSTFLCTKISVGYLDQFYYTNQNSD